MANKEKPDKATSHKKPKLIKKGVLMDFKGKSNEEIFAYIAVNSAIGTAISLLYLLLKDKKGMEKMSEVFDTKKAGGNAENAS